MSKTKIIFKNAMLITILIGGFFFLSKLFGHNETNYATNYGIAFGTSALGVIFSTIGVLIYVSLINPNFLNELNNSFLIGGNLSIYELVFTLIIEGLASSIVGSLMVMQFFKNHQSKVQVTA
jgi:putative Mn2+ efflux pump MntP